MNADAISSLKKDIKMIEVAAKAKRPVCEVTTWLERLLACLEIGCETNTASL